MPKPSGKEALVSQECSSLTLLPEYFDLFFFMTKNVSPLRETSSAVWSGAIEFVFAVFCMFS